ncbi:UvrD-helicase domain-containing protein [Chromobacterium vaccinii]|uniref:UvrD-helicase domain-containing protein n=1 Tax=Chromobacterium vaccinii TaxID=1108595 RepID=UPI003C758F0C
MSSKPITDEQLAVVECNKRDICVNAFAGSGKTTTVEAYARHRPRVKMLYLAFNKAMQVEAKARFPPNVKCMTTHAVAYSTTGREYQHKLLHGSHKPFTIGTNLGVNFEVAATGIRLVDAFLASSCDRLEDVFPSKLSAEEADTATRIWRGMCDKDNTAIGMTHDGYLKLFQLSRPTLNYGTILYDEAQDANAVTTAIVADQMCGKVYVGDRHQQIYSFRGAVNAMDNFDGERLYLTQSFRFGQPVADVANALLGLKDESLLLYGMRQGSQVHLEAPVSNQGLALICRTNAGVFMSAVEAISDGAGRKLGFVGGIDGYRFGLIEDTWRLFSNQIDAIQDRYIKSFGSYSRMVEVAEATDDPELKALQKAIDSYGGQIPSLIQAVRMADAHSIDHADTVLMTAHKCKGLQFRNVRLLDDFFDPSEYKEKLRQKLMSKLALDSEINLLYVAATRAIEQLYLNSMLASWLLFDTDWPDLYPETLDSLKPSIPEGKGEPESRVT